MAIDGGDMTVGAPSGGSNPHTGGNGNGGNGNNSGSSSGSPAQALAPIGLPVAVAPVNGVWGITIFNTTAIADALAAALASLEKGLMAGLPVASRVAGVFGLLAPSQLAPATVDPMKGFAGFAVALPASKVLSGSLPTTPATVVSAPVKARLVDDVKDEKQHVAAVSIKGVTQSVPVVDAKPTNKPGVYSASIVPGMPAMEVRVSAAKPGVQSPAKGMTPEKGEARPAGYTSGGSTHDAILRFPSNTKIDPLYVSVTKTLTPAELKQRQEKEDQYKAAWDATHPVEVAQRELKAATAEFQNASNDVKALQDEIAELTKRIPVLKSNAEHPVRGQDQLNRTMMKEYQNALARSLEAPKELSIALEKRNKKETQKKDAESKLEKENKRNLPGVAKGKGKKVIGKWLDDVAKDSGSAIPDRIADKLRDKEFKNFDEFRKALWKEVSKDSELASGFSKSNRTRMSKGMAPRARAKDTVGGRRSLEVHHKNPIAKGGAVYDMDNLSVTTPKLHINIHKGGK